MVKKIRMRIWREYDVELYLDREGAEDSFRRSAEGMVKQSSTSGVMAANHRIVDDPECRGYEILPDPGEEDAWCSECGRKMTLVRPGKHQCDTCDELDYLRRRVEELEARFLPKETPAYSNPLILEPGKKLAAMVTYLGEKVIRREPVQVEEDHVFLAGPYQDTVPFSVGSNQQIVEMDEQELEALDAWWLRLEAESAGDSVVRECLDRMGDPVRIEHNGDDIGDGLVWSVITGEDFTMDAFKTREEAEAFVRAVRWPLQEPAE